MIFYFSATGNSKYLARIIADKTGESLVDITKAVLNNEYSFVLSDKERLGFVIPVYFYGIASAVLDFIARLDIKYSDSNYSFVAFTCGGSTGAADKMLSKALSEKGIKLDAFFAAVMVDNYIPMFKIDSQQQAKAKLDSVKDKLYEIAKQIENRQTGDFNTDKGISLMTKLLYPLYKPMCSTKRFFADESCVGCGKCANECICRAIEMKHGKPVWVKDKCTGCMHCIHSCPKKAIQFGKNTKRKNRYINPYVDI